MCIRDSIYTLAIARLGKRYRKRRDRRICFSVPHDMVFRIRSADLYRHAGPVCPNAHFLFSCAQCDLLTKNKENNPEDFYNRFVLSSLYRGYVGHAE